MPTEMTAIDWLRKMVATYRRNHIEGYCDHVEADWLYLSQSYGANPEAPTLAEIEEALRRQPVTEEMVEAADEMRGELRCALTGKRAGECDPPHSVCAACETARAFDTARAKVGK